MARLWKASVLVVALAVVACENQDPPIYKDIVDQAVEIYNSGRPGKPLLRLKDVTVSPDQNPTSNFPLKLRTVETDCISNPENCNFLENGGAQVNGSPDDSVAAASEKDQLRDVPPNIRNIYENAKYDIIKNILQNF